MHSLRWAAVERRIKEQYNQGTGYAATDQELRLDYRKPNLYILTYILPGASFGTCATDPGHSSACRLSCEPGRGGPPGAAYQAPGDPHSARAQRGRAGRCFGV